jgi:hypothetical protein
MHRGQDINQAKNKTKITQGFSCEDTHIPSAASAAFPRLFLILDTTTVSNCLLLIPRGQFCQDES